MLHQLDISTIYLHLGLVPLQCELLHRLPTLDKRSIGANGDKLQCLFRFKIATAAFIQNEHGDATVKHDSFIQTL
jgi:hypothetical protein